MQRRLIFFIFKRAIFIGAEIQHSTTLQKEREIKTQEKYKENKTESVGYNLNYRLTTMCYNRKKSNKDKLYTREILKEKRLNKVHFHFLLKWSVFLLLTATC